MNKIRTWGFYNQLGEELPPLVFSNGKTQQSIIEEIIQAFKSNDIVFLKALVGSGKSVIATTICKLMGRGIIVVPVKKLQEQYENDYSAKRYIDLGSGRARIKQIKGRGNFKCPSYGGSASRRDLPCTRKLSKELEETRWNVASTCPMWNPIYPTPQGGIPLEYQSISGTKYYLKRGSGCEYCDQFESYVNADIIVMNSAKWTVETHLGRKPSVAIECIDESDLFLDQLTLDTSIGETIARKLGKIGLNIQEELSLVLKGKLDPKEFLAWLIKELDYFEDEYASELHSKLSLISQYKEVLETRVEGKSVRYFVPYPDLVLKHLLSRSAPKLLFMSATTQAPMVLKEIYNIEPVFVEGEIKFPGTILHRKTGKEQLINYQKWKSQRVREAFWNCLEEILDSASRPILVNVHAYEYLPEQSRGLIPSRDEVREFQDREIDYFTSGTKDIIFTTKLDRGIDLPDEKCRAIVLLKYPYPKLTDPVLQAMAKRLGNVAFNRYYEDVAAREFIQSIGRAVRSKNDFEEFWSPDLRCHIALHELWKGDII
ncbi:MAG: helicase C-terminal domain-containing protein [Methanocellales archaeon]